MTVGSGAGIQSQPGCPPVRLCPLHPVSIFSIFRKGPLYAPVGYLLLLLSVPAAGWAPPLFSSNTPFLIHYG